MIPIHEDGKQKGKINQTILQTGKPKSHYKLGDTHPKKKYEGVYFLQYKPIKHNKPNPEQWGRIEQVDVLLKEREKQKQDRKKNTKDDVYTGLNKGCLPQKVLQVEGSYKPGDIHPNIPDLVLIKNARNRSYPQRWGTLEQYEEKKRKMREAEEQKRRARGVKPFSTTQTDQSITFKRLDPHPTIKGLFFIGYHFDKRINRRVETWKTKEQYHSMLERGRLYNEDNKERIIQNRKEYRIKNAKKIKERKALEYSILKETRKFKDKRNAYNRKRMKQDECFRLSSLLRSRIRNAVKFQRGEKAYATMELIGCTVEHLRDHLEAQFTDGMTWDNMGRGGWQMDHIIPCNVFDLTNPSHQKVCFNWQNIQPLWERDNILKDDNIHWSIVLTLMMNNYKTIGLI